MLSNVLVVALVATFAGCGADDDSVTAQDPARPDSSSASEVSAPTAVPAAPGPVRSRSVATVMDTGSGPELCLGPVAESYPPQCGGPGIAGWDWAAQSAHSDRQGMVRWGEFSVTGSFDGTTFTVSDAVPAALFRPDPEVPVDLPEPARDYPPAELEALAFDLGASVPGAQGAYADTEGHILLDVLYDDGSIQDHLDAEHGSGVVVVTSALVDV